MRAADPPPRGAESANLEHAPIDRQDARATNLRSGGADAPARGGALTAGYPTGGLRAWKQTSSGLTYFLYDGSLPVAELDSTGSVIAVNTFGANGLLSRHANRLTTFYTFDQQGSVAQRLDSGGNVLSSHMFDAYGLELSTPATSEPWGFGAQWSDFTDHESGLVLMGHRYYDPHLARFLTRDPSGYAAGLNLYAYAGNNPASYADPDGHFFFLITGAVGTVVAAEKMVRFLSPAPASRRLVEIRRGGTEGFARPAPLRPPVGYWSGQHRS